jgi:hypothetical protein
MPDLALYSQIVDVLLAEHEASTAPRPADEAMARKLGVTWGPYCQVHRLARAAMALVDNGMGQEAIVPLTTGRHRRRPGRIDIEAGPVAAADQPGHHRPRRPGHPDRPPAPAGPIRNTCPVPVTSTRQAGASSRPASQEADPVTLGHRLGAPALVTHNDNPGRSWSPAQYAGPPTTRGPGDITLCIAIGRGPYPEFGRHDQLFSDWRANMEQTHAPETAADQGK